MSMVACGARPRQLPAHFAVLLAVTFLFAAAAAAQQYPFLRVSKDADPKFLTLLMQDSQGRLWVGSNSGAFIYDGSRFLPVLGGLGQHGTSYSQAVRSFAEDDSGGIWIASGGGMQRYGSGWLQLVTSGSWVAVVRVDGNLMLGVKEDEGHPDSQWNHLFRFSWDGKNWVSERLGDLDVVSHRSLTRDPSGAIVYPCGAGWCELTADAIRGWRSDSARPVQVRRHATPEELRVPGTEENPLKRVFHDRHGCMWFLTFETAFRQCPGNSHLEKLTRGAQADQVELLGAPDQNLLFLSASLMLEDDSGKLLVARHSNGLPDSATGLVGEDGTIWLGGADGLIRFPYPFRMEYWTNRDGYEGGFPITRVGSRIVAASGHDLVTLNADRTRWVALAKDRDLGLFLQLFPTERNTMYATIWNRGLFELSEDGSVLRSLHNSTGAWRLFRDRQAALWLAGPGISRITNEGSTLQRRIEQLPGKNLFANDIGSALDGRLWVCYWEGLAYRGTAGWNVAVHREPDLPRTCSAMAIDSDGDIWYGYVGRLLGLTRIHLTSSESSYHPQLETFTNEGDPDFSVVFVTADHRKWIWVGADGLYVASEKQAQKQQWWHLNEMDGLPKSAMNEHSFMEDSDGSVWFSANDTIVHFKPPPDLTQSNTPPRVFLSAYSVNGETPVVAETVSSFKYGDSVIAHIGSLQFDRRNNLAVRYRVLPEQPSWTETRTLDVKLGRSHWGSHTLEFQARLGPGPWSKTVEHSFTVLRPFWLAWPFLLAVSFTAASAAGGAVILHRQAEQRRKKLLPDLAELRLAVLSPEVHELRGRSLAERFEIGNVLARGGFATVVTARDLHEGGRVCAVKLFRKDWADKGWLKKRFQHEVQALQLIQHRHIVRTIGHGMTPSGAPYLAMEFIEGNTLRDVLSTGSIAPLKAATYLRQIGSALAEIHSRGICHRDLKPENLMVREGGDEIVLIDFSIAIIRDPDETFHGISRAAGTVYYMAPEQAVGYATHSSDIYSLAKIVIEMLAGNSLWVLLPDASIDLPERVRRLLAGPGFQLSKDSIELIARALEFHPGDRPGDVLQFATTIADDLEHVRTS